MGVGPGGVLGHIMGVGAQQQIIFGTLNDLKYSLNGGLSK